MKVDRSAGICEWIKQHLHINLKTAIESADYADFRRFSSGYCFLRITPGGRTDNMSQYFDLSALIYEICG
jgi:hypothetical protein